MPRGSKKTYTDKQKRMAKHIEESYESRGLNEDESARRAWATVNKETGGGEKSRGGGTRKSDRAKKASRKSVGRNAAASRNSGETNLGRKNAGETSAKRVRAKRALTNKTGVTT